MSLQRGVLIKSGRLTDSGFLKKAKGFGQYANENFIIGLGLERCRVL